MAVSYHTHQFEIPTASGSDVIAGISDDKAVTPFSLAGVFATYNQGIKADTAMQAATNVVTHGASPSNTSAQNEVAFDAAEIAANGRPIYVPSGVYQLSTPQNRGYKALYFGPGVLRFDNAVWSRRGGSAGPGTPEKYTLFYDYESTSDVTVSFDGVLQATSWVGNFTVQAPASVATQRVDITVQNGLIGFGAVPESVRAQNAIDGRAASLSPDQTDPLKPLKGYNNWVIGVGVPSALTTGINNTFGGSRAGRSMQTGINNTALGFQALYRATGDGNTAVGSIAGEWITTGQYNSLYGGSSGSKIETGQYNTAAGYASFSENQTGNYNVAIGHRALANPREDIGGTPNETVAIGVFAGDFAFGDKNLFAGYRAGNGVVGGSDGTENVGLGFFALRNHAGADYNVAVGVSSLLNLTSGQSNVAIGHSALAAVTTVGGQTAVGYQALTANTTGSENVAFGAGSLRSNVSGSGNTAAGTSSLELATTSFNSTFGTRAGAALTTGQGLTAVGYEAGRFQSTTNFGTFIGYRAGRATTGEDNTAIGGDALIFNTSGIQNTALGRAALRVDQSATNQTTFNNTTGVGYGASVSGSNQVQLGNSATTTYVYGTVQNRSDERDKADIRNTALGLDFIMALRPVDYRLDLREDYIAANDNGEVVHLERDGSRKRNRFHHGFIAQEIAASGYDFGGFQDHSMNGGNDVLSLGYDEFIAPVTRAIQESYQHHLHLVERVDALELRVSGLEEAA
jgi:hypothetical protein